jgi:hypothetical protein
MGGRRAAVVVSTLTTLNTVDAMYTPPDDVVVYEFPKNHRERVRVAVRRFLGRQVLDFRTYFRARDGRLLATAKGLTVSASQIPELKAGIAAIEAELRSQGAA